MAQEIFVSRLAQEKREFIEQCTFCGKCLEHCPVRPFSRYADGDPVELQRARINFLKGGEFSQAVYDMAFCCMGCSCCAEDCSAGLDPSRIGTISRTELVNRDHSAPPTYSFSVPSERFSYFKVISALLINPSQTRWLTEVPDSPEHADVVYFLGCGLHTMPDRLFTSLDIVDRMGLNHVSLGGITFCCGAPYMNAGRGAECGEYGKRLVEAISAFTPKTVVSFCPGCTFLLSKGYIGHPEAPFRSMHFATFLGENFDRLKFEKPIDKTVTIHDPCQLGRGIGEFEGARRVLKAIPGMQVVEMEHWGEHTLCCGGTASQADPEAAKQIARIRLEEAKKTSADLLVDLCLGCHLTFRQQVEEYPFEIVSFVTLVGRAMGIEYEDKLSLYLEWRDVNRVVEDARANIEASPFSEQEVRNFLELLFSAS